MESAIAAVFDHLKIIMRNRNMEHKSFIHETETMVRTVENSLKLKELIYRKLDIADLKQIQGDVASFEIDGGKLFVNIYREASLSNILTYKRNFMKHYMILEMMM